MEQHSILKHGKIGVLLINLGTPDEPSAKAVRVYLQEFLSDKRVIEIPSFLWQIILRGIILPFRSGKTAKAYAKIWQPEGSPLKVITEKQAVSLQKHIAHEDIVVGWAMRYGSGDIETAIAGLRKQGCHKILFCPLYPQYAAATTASVADKVFQILQGERWQPSVRFLPPYYDDGVYIDVLVKQILAQVHFDDKRQNDNYRQALLVSFHGLPKRSLELGDPYYCHCYKTARLLKEALGLKEEQLFLGFQSRFGKQEWLQPYADKLVRSFPDDGIKRLAVICPGFSADCLETLEEVNMGLRLDFLNAGGEVFDYIFCLNDSADGMGLLLHLVENELRGWVN